MLWHAAAAATRRKSLRTFEKSSTSSSGSYQFPEIKPISEQKKINYLQEKISDKLKSSMFRRVFFFRLFISLGVFNREAMVAAVRQIRHALYISGGSFGAMVFVWQFVRNTANSSVQLNTEQRMKKSREQSEGRK